jgi:hypothetical protein
VDSPPQNGAAHLPDRLIAVDWSGRIDVAGQRRHIWAATWTSAEASGRGRASFRLEGGRTREELIAWLIECSGETPRMVAGFDCCFSFPAWFLAEHGCGSALEFWRHCAAGHAERWLAGGSSDGRRDERGIDRSDERSDRLSLDSMGEHNDEFGSVRGGQSGEELRGYELGDATRDERFWGKPHKRPAQFSGEHLHRMLRRTDVESKIVAEMTDPARQLRVRGIAPKSPFQIGGSGSVGTGSLRAMQHLLGLAEAGWGVWPFFGAMADLEPQSARSTSPPAPPREAQRSAQYPLAIEIYSRLMTGPVVKSSAEARVAYLQARRAANPLYRALPPTVVARARSSEDAFDALISMMNMLEHRAALARLTPTTDPIYRLEGQTWSPDPA